MAIDRLEGDSDGRMAQKQQSRWPQPGPGVPLCTLTWRCCRHPYLPSWLLSLSLSGTRGHMVPLRSPGPGARRGPPSWMVSNTGAQESRSLVEGHVSGLAWPLDSEVMESWNEESLWT